MAKIVEMCGAPGVGKSTIFKEIENRKGENRKWATATNLNPFIRKSLPYFVEKVVRAINNRKSYNDSVALKDAGDRFVTQFPEYINACWSNIFYRQNRSFNGLDVRFEKAAFLNRIIQKIQVIRESKSDKIIIIDEGLINLIDRGLHKSANSVGEREEIQNLLELMPLPDALVYIEADIKENAHRLLHREKVRDMHKKLSEKELINCTLECKERLFTTIKILEGKGMPVLYLDSKNAVDFNANKIVEFTESLNFTGVFTPLKKAITL